jgi:hypothetical protein
MSTTVIAWGKGVYFYMFPLGELGFILIAFMFGDDVSRFSSTINISLLAGASFPNRVFKMGLYIVWNIPVSHNANNAQKCVPISIIDHL